MKPTVTARCALQSSAFAPGGKGAQFQQFLTAVWSEERRAVYIFFAIQCVDDFPNVEAGSLASGGVSMVDVFQSQGM